MHQTCRFALIVFVFGAATPVLRAQDQEKPYDPYNLPDDQVVSYTKDIRPILDNKCVACHACFDAPAQLNLTNSEAIKRGANKKYRDPYALTIERKPFHRMENSSKPVEELRKLGWFSVIEGGEDSVMAKMIKLGYEHKWKPNEQIPKHIDIYSLTRQVFAPNDRDIDGYTTGYPLQGMPLAVADLTAEEYGKMMTWLKRGAKFDDVKPQPTAADQAKIAEWEKMLNRKDKRHQLVARYVYEHYASFHFYLDDDSPHQYMLIRSSTPPGQEPVYLEARVPNDPVDGPFYYRFNIIDFTLHYKRHNVLDASGGRLDRIKELFFSGDWTVDELPGWTAETKTQPLLTFAAIPAKARYKFLLDDCYHFERVITQDDACRSSMATSVTPEQGWSFFEHPDKDLYCNNAEFRKAVTPETGMITDTTDIGTAIASYRDLSKRGVDFRQKYAALLKDGAHSRIEDLAKVSWTCFRHNENAEAIDGLVGRYPKRTIIQNFTIFERRIYVVINYDVFNYGLADFEARAQIGFYRNQAELNYLRFLPPETRAKVFKRLNASPPQFLVFQQYKEKNELQNLEGLETGIEYTTDDPEREFYDKVIAYFGDAVETADPIARPKPGAEADEVTQAWQLIMKESEKQGAWFKTMLPEASFLRINSEGKEPSFYTMTLDWDVVNTHSIAGSLYHYPDDGKDQVSVTPGTLSYYPNFIFQIDEKDVLAFAKALTSAGEEKEFLAVVDRWGVRRTNPDFWSIFHSATDYVKRVDPRRASVFDLNRYVDF